MGAGLSEGLCDQADVTLIDRADTFGFRGRESYQKTEAVTSCWTKMHRMLNEIDYKTSAQYWDGAATHAATAAYLAHEQGVPDDCVQYRFDLEASVIGAWTAGIPNTSALDVGCGPGMWTGYLAKRFARVTGIERSAPLLATAAERTQGLPNAELLHGEAIEVLGGLEGDFDLAFIGSLMMYLNRADAVDLLRVIRSNLGPKGVVIDRETTIARGVRVQTGDYPVVYRSIAEYRAIAHEAGYQVVEVRVNAGYEAMEIAVKLVSLLRCVPLLRRARQDTIGCAVWRAPRLTQPVSLRLVPALLRRLGVTWPQLSNHFFRLAPTPGTA